MIINHLHCLATRMISTEMKKLRPICFCGPSGSGKSTLINQLRAEFPNVYAFSISHTTREPRVGEVNGENYHFVSREQMLMGIANNEFLEYTEFGGNLYGTSKKSIENVLASGRICTLDVDIKGVVHLKATNLNPIYIFIKPPCLNTLERRLRLRGTETEDSLKRRLEIAKQELEYEQNEKGAFDITIINNDLNNAYESLKAYLKQMEQK